MRESLRTSAIKVRYGDSSPPDRPLIAVPTVATGRRSPRSVAPRVVEWRSREDDPIAAGGSLTVRPPASASKVLLTTVRHRIGCSKGADIAPGSPSTSRSGAPRAVQRRWSSHQVAGQHRCGNERPTSHRSRGDSAYRGRGRSGAGWTTEIGGIPDRPSGIKHRQDRRIFISRRNRGSTRQLQERRRCARTDAHREIVTDRTSR